MNGIDVVKKAINDYFESEDFEPEDFSNPKKIGLCYTDSLGRDGEMNNMQWYADIVNMEIYLMVNDEVVPGTKAWMIQFKDYGDMADEINLNDYADWVARADDYAEEHL